MCNISIFIIFFFKYKQTIKKTILGTLKNFYRNQYCSLNISHHILLFIQNTLYKIVDVKGHPYCRPCNRYFTGFLNKNVFDWATEKFETQHPYGYPWQSRHHIFTWNYVYISFLNFFSLVYFLGGLLKSLIWSSLIFIYWFIASVGSPRFRDDSRIIFHSNVKYCRVMWQIWCSIKNVLFGKISKSGIYYFWLNVESGPKSNRMCEL